MLTDLFAIAIPGSFEECREAAYRNRAMKERPIMSEILQTLEMILNIATYHREHEKYYAHVPLQNALALQQTSHALLTLADRWRSQQGKAPQVGSPFMGCPDLNELMTIQYCGILFMEGQGEPREITDLKHKLSTSAEAFDQAGQWLEEAMQSAWAVMQPLLQFPPLAKTLGERHRIIINDWQTARQAALIATLLKRVLEILRGIDFLPSAIRADLAGPHVFSEYLYAAAELINRAADLASESAILIHDNERRWRIYRECVQQAYDEQRSLDTYRTHSPDQLQG
jgi:hypothetical protein